MKTAGMLGVCVMVLGLGLAASASPIVVWDGSFLVPTPEPGFTSENICFVRAGNTRPGSGQTVIGPSLVIGWETRGTDGGVREINAIPALVKTLPLNTAQWVTVANGGTSFAGFGGQGSHKSGPSDVDSAGQFWGPGGGGAGGGSGLSRDLTNYVLGGSSAITRTIPETGWGGTGLNDYSSPSGVLRRADGYGNNLPTDGSQIGAKFVVASRGNGGTYDSQVVQATRTGSTTMSNTLLFHPYSALGSWDNSMFDLQYARDTIGNEWFVLCRVNLTTTNSWVLDFYNGGINDGGNHTRDFSVEIATASGMRAGVGNMSSAGYLRDIAVDWANSKLYVLEANGYAASRVHVFTLYDEVPLVPEPASLGVLLLGLPLLRRRRG